MSPATINTWADNTLVYGTYTFSRSLVPTAEVDVISLEDLNISLRELRLESLGVGGVFARQAYGWKSIRAVLATVDATGEVWWFLSQSDFKRFTQEHYPERHRVMRTTLKKHLDAKTPLHALGLKIEVAPSLMEARDLYPTLLVYGLVDFKASPY